MPSRRPVSARRTARRSCAGAPSGEGRLLVGCGAGRIAVLGQNLDQAADPVEKAAQVVGVEGVEHLTRSIVNKLMHAPISRLRDETDREAGLARLEEARALFALDDLDAPGAHLDGDLEATLTDALDRADASEGAQEPDRAEASGGIDEARETGRVTDDERREGS